MIKKLIVGSGFSGSITNLLLDKQVKIFGINDLNNLNLNNFIKRKNLNCNKFFCKKSLSFGSTKFQLKRSILHDRPIFGGNSNVWGGHINIKKLSKRFLDLFIKKKISIKKLSYSITGTTSSNNHIAQLQNTSGKILRSNDILQNIQNAIILDFSILKKKIFINVLFLDNLKKKKKLKLKNFSFV